MSVIDRKMFTPLGYFFLVIFGTECIVSLLGNGFITVVNGYSWLQSRKMVLCDFLLTSLSLSRFLWQWVSMINQFVFLRSPETYVHHNKLQTFTFPWMYLNVASIWCATWLNVFYCVKVINFAHPLFAWLKRGIGVWVPRCLGISLLAYIICSIYPLMGYFEDEKSHNLTGNLAGNTSQTEAHDHYSVKSSEIIQISFTAISFSICLTASGVLLLSLWRHRRNLKKSGLGTKDLSTQAHLNVMKPLLLSLVFFIIHFAAMIISISRVFEYGKLERLISDIFMSSYPSAHSIILIFTSPKLRKVYTHILNHRSPSGRGHKSHFIPDK